MYVCVCGTMLCALYRSMEVWKEWFHLYVASKAHFANNICSNRSYICSFSSPMYECAEFVCVWTVYRFIFYTAFKAKLGAFINWISGPFIFIARLLNNVKSLLHNNINEWQEHFHQMLPKMLEHKSHAAMCRTQLNHSFQLSKFNSLQNKTLSGSCEISKSSIITRTHTHTIFSPFIQLNGNLCCEWKLWKLIKIICFFIPFH